MARHSLSILAGLFALCASAAYAGPGVPGLPFYESVQTKVCNNATTCKLTFAAVPAGNALEITNVVCALGVDPVHPRVTLEFFQGPLSKAEPKDHFSINPTQRTFSKDAQVRSFYRAGTKPGAVLIVPESPFISLGCKISGKLHKLP